MSGATVGLRPIERVILRLRSQGVAVPEIAHRLGKRPGTVDRIITMIQYKDDLTSPRRDEQVRLRPVERVVLRLLRSGQNYGEIGNRLGRSGAQIRRIAHYAELKLDA